MFFPFASVFNMRDRILERLPVTQLRESKLFQLSYFIFGALKLAFVHFKATQCSIWIWIKLVPTSWINILHFCLSNE